MGWRKTIKKTLTGITAAALLASGVGAGAAFADTDQEKIMVPIGQVMQSIEGCQLSPTQLSKEQVSVLEKCVSEDYLDELGTTSQQETVSQANEAGTPVRTPIDADLSDYGIDHFWFHYFDGDDKIEGAFAYNGQDGTYIASYPFGEEDGEQYNKVFFIPGQETVEIRSGNLDGDEQEEFTVFTDENAYNFDFNLNEQDFDIKRYPAPRGKEITDGQIEDGVPYIATNDASGYSDIDLDFYRLNEGGNWEEFISDIAKKTALDSASPSFSSFHPKSFLIGNWDSDEDKELIAAEGINNIYINGSNRVEPGILFENMSLSDIQEANYNPWEDKDKEIITVPSVEKQKIYQNSNDAPGISAFQTPKPDTWLSKYAGEEGEGIHIAYQTRDSGLLFTDVQIPDWEEMQPDSARWYVGSKDWWKYWGSKYHRTSTNNSHYPIIASTTDKVGSGTPLVNTTSRFFSPKYTEGFHMGNYDSDEHARSIEEAKVIELE